MPDVRVFAGSPMTISFGLACRDHTLVGILLCRLLQKVYGLGQWFSTGGRFPFF